MTALVDQLYQNRLEVECAAARALAGQFREMAARINEIEAERLKLEDELMAAREFFRGRQQSGSKVTADDFSSAATAATVGLNGYRSTGGLNPGLGFPMSQFSAQAPMLQAVERLFEFLCGCEAEEQYPWPRIPKTIDKRPQPGNFRADQHFIPPQPPASSPPPAIAKAYPIQRRSA